MKHKLESRLPGEISITSDMQMTPPLSESEEELKSLLMKVKEESEKVGLYALRDALPVRILLAIPPAVLLLYVSKEAYERIKE